MQSIVDLHKYNYNFLKVSDFPTLIFLQNSKQMVITNGYSISEGKSAIDHVFPISCGGVPILEDAGILRAFRFRFVLFSPVFPNPPRILHLPPVKALRCRYK